MTVVELNPREMHQAGAVIIGPVSTAYTEGARAVNAGAPSGLDADLRIRAEQIARTAERHASIATARFGVPLIARSMVVSAADSVSGGTGTGHDPGPAFLMPAFLRPWFRPNSIRGIIQKLLDAIRRLAPDDGRTPPPHEPPGRGSGGGSGRGGSGGATGNATLDWAKSMHEHHNESPPDDVRSLTDGWTNDWGADGGWGHDCIKFAKAAWVKGSDGGISLDEIPSGATAKKVFENFASTHPSLVHHGGTPPAGAMVFWTDALGSAGHVAIADGQGGFYETVGGDSNGINDDGIDWVNPTAEGAVHHSRNGASMGNSAGWISIEEFRAKVGT